MICEKCKLQLAKNEENFALCPHCAEIIKENLPKNSNDRLIIYAESVILKKIIKISNYFCVIVFILILLFGLEFIIERKINEINSNIMVAIRYMNLKAMYSKRGEFLPVYIAMAVYGLTRKAKKFRNIYIFEDYKLNLLFIILIKWLIYILVVIVLFKTFYRAEYIFVYDGFKTYKADYTFEEGKIALSLIMKKHEIRIIYSFFICAIMDIVDVFVNLKVYNINRKINTK